MRPVLASAIAISARQLGPGNGRLALRLAGVPALPGATRLLHVTATARRRYRVPEDAFGLSGRLVHVELEQAARIASELRSDGSRDASAASLVAAIVLHELMHAVLSTVSWQPAASAKVVSRLGVAGARSAEREFGDTYAASPVGRQPDPDTRSDEGVPVTTLEELGLLGLGDANPALEPFAALFEPGEARARLEPAWRAVIAGFASVPLPEGADTAGLTRQAGEGDEPQVVPSELEAPAGMGAGSLLDLLTLPVRLHPRSLRGQLETALEAWRRLLGDGSDELVRRVLRAMDALREEELRAEPGAPPGPPAAWQAGPQPEELGEPRYSEDEPWMAGASIVAKSLPVWLEQLSRWYGREVRRLDQVPDEALAGLAEDGFDTLWLVGVWERSAASQRIKRLQGQSDALASAYAVHDHVIAADLGGEEAFQRLKDRAAHHGLRLAADMVANHTGIDSRWVEEHPDWFVQSSSPPFPNYSYNGQDLSPGRPIAVRIEDGYYGGRDAAVAFQRVDRATGQERYLYHGNDGTGLPWNDTAQIDFLKRDARKAVIDTAVAVAQRFPVLRFDAAMALVRRHVRRLWHPAPGEGGAIPSRSAAALPQEEFDAAMPREFWLEVVEAVAERAPGTMLLAEAFWLMEETFVRHLGFNRVYHSAFMQLLAERRDADLKELLQEVAARDPGVVERYVNYLTTPDEESARSTFGAGDRYFGVATLLCTLPGLPLFGHGQAEGLFETYGMEFGAPRIDERPDEEFRQRHRRELAPLLSRRERFAYARDLRFMRFVGERGEVPSVHAYGYASNGEAGACLVLFNHSENRVSGTVVAAGGTPWEALGLAMPRPTQELVADVNGRGTQALWGQDQLIGGWRFELGANEALVLLDLRIQGLPVAIDEAAGAERRAMSANGLPVRAAALRRARSRRRGAGGSGGA